MSEIKVVIDTQIFLRAVINIKSLPTKIIFDLNNRYQLVISQAIMDEIEEVLNRPKIRTKLPQITDNLVE